jgi:hypothetical protein
MVTNNLVKEVLQNGGELHPLIIPSNKTNGTGLMNPSIFVDGNKLLCNIRHVNYTLFHCEGNTLYGNRHGPISYINPENDVNLRTNNFLAELNDDFTIRSVNKIDTKDFDVEPKWTFIGLEDARVVRWDEKLWFCGVRRDTTTNGQGRMELSEIIGKREISRNRISPPNNLDTYCEKNWMPVIDLPYHFIKWSNPTELVKVDVKNKTSETVILKNGLGKLQNLRGGSQVIRYGNKWLCIVHECDLWYNKLNQRDAKYTHRFVMWDENWNIDWISDSFSFMDGEVEFCCGLAEWKNDLLLSFGFQDNAAFILKLPKQFFNKIANITKKDYWKITPYPTIEITTSIPKKGCIVDCAFCPQKTLLNVYDSDKTMEYEKFVDMIDRLPSNQIRITFSGFTEPFLNRRTADMILYAHNKGHRISVFTTGVGLRKEDIDKIKHINFSHGPNSGFILHLPDSERIAKHPITKEYIEVVEYIKTIENEINGFGIMSMGEVHESVKHIYPTAHIPTFWSRAGNLLGEAMIKPELEKIKDRFQHMDHGGKEMTCNCLEDLYHNVLLPDGRLSLCCMDYGLKHILGNLWEQEYEDIIPKPFTCFTLCSSCENGIEPKNKNNA